MKALFVFAGQGAQTVGMCQDLAAVSNSAAAVFNQADEILGYPLSDIVKNGPIEKLTECRYCQTAIYTASCAALAAFREKFDITPVACAGLSLGEYGALYCAGAIDFATGIRLLERRGTYMGESCEEQPGTMASVLGADPELVAEVCQASGIDVANYNCPGQIVISGSKDKVAAAVDALKNAGVRKVIPLVVAGGFHSRLMKKAGERLAADLAAAHMEVPSVPVYHNVSGSVARSAEEMRAALTSQVSGSVRWEDCVRNAASDCGADTLIEFGPGNVLAKLTKRILPEMRTFNVNGVESLTSIVQ